MSGRRRPTSSAAASASRSRAPVTPYVATQYTLAHLGLDPSLTSSVSTAYYEAGHMMYSHTGELAHLRKDVGAFVTAALKR